MNECNNFRGIYITTYTWITNYMSASWSKDLKNKQKKHEIIIVKFARVDGGPREGI